MNPSVGSRVLTLLSNDASIIARIGDPPRVYPGKAPQNSSLPRVVYTVVDELKQNSMQGYTSSLVNARVQIDCYAKSYLEAQNLADEIGAVLDSQVEPDLSSTEMVRRDVYEDSLELHRITIDYSLWLRELD